MLKKSLIAMCNVNIFNMLCLRTCGSECIMNKVVIYYNVVLYSSCSHPWTRGGCNEANKSDVVTEKRFLSAKIC